MIVLGIDPGTAKMGYGILDYSPRKKVKLIETNVFSTPAELEQHKRLKIIYKNLNDIIKLFSPEVMVIEKLFFNTNVKTAMHVGQARGISMLAAAQKNLDVFEYTALEAKHELTGYGRSDKKQMQEAVKQYLQLETIIKSDDANDAVAMALCYIRKHLVKKL